MKLSVGAIGLAILVIALDFAVVRAACLSPTPQERAFTGAPLLPGTLAGRLLRRGPDGWAVFAFFLLPMINALLIGVYRLRRRGDHTAGTFGYVAAGSVASLAVFTSCLIWPGTAIGTLTPLSRRLALACFDGLAWLFEICVLPVPRMPGWPVLALEWTYMVIFAVLIPMTFFCIPPLLVAVIGRRGARLVFDGATSVPKGAKESNTEDEGPSANDQGLITEEPGSNELAAMRVDPA